MSPISLSDIESAARRLDGHILRTPLLESPGLSELAGCRLLVKAELLQKTGAFKIRGALNKMLSLPEAVRAKGVVASSSGNHGNALAAAAKMFGVSSKIVMPADAPAMKIDNTRRHGAEIILYDREREDRFAIVEKLARDTGMINVPPFDDVDVMSGQGTAGIELMEQCRALGASPDAVLIPSSGGGLSSGITVAVKAHSPAHAMLHGRARRLRPHGALARERRAAAQREERGLDPGRVDRCADSRRADLRGALGPWRDRPRGDG